MHVTQFAQRTKPILSTTMLLFCAVSGFAAEPERVFLWPGKAPGALGDAAKDRPSVEVRLPAPEKATGVAIVVCPGGGYGGLAMNHEGDAIARWLNKHGIAAFILDYRHRGKGYRHPAPLLDAQRAIRLVRSRSDQWNIDSNRVGIIGFSAGGHLASTAATHFDRGQPKSQDIIERASCRPDFAILCYAVIALDRPYTHRGSQRNLLGDNAPEELVASLSNERQVTSETPPTFLWHTDQDRVVPAENSVMFYLALRKAQVPAELHIFRIGKHGRGLAATTRGTDQWPALCLAWLENLGILKGGSK